MKEMEWVVRTFEYMREKWEVRARNMGNEKPGHKAYAIREAETWQEWVEMARAEFAEVVDANNIPI